MLLVRRLDSLLVKRRILEMILKRLMNSRRGLLHSHRG